MRKIKVVAVGVAGICALGCAPGPRAGAGERPASSLVYSPAARLPADREQPAARAASDAQGLRTGVRCRVHLRRDAAGLAGQSPVSIVGTSMISERASVVGTIERVDPDAIILRGDGSTYWIPRSVILAVEFPDERRP